VIAFGDPEVPEGCVAPSGSVVPDNLVLFEGDWLLIGRPDWDDLLREDPRVMDWITPWSSLDAATRMLVHVLDSNDPSLCRNAEEVDPALRDPTGRFRRDLEQLGAFEDGQLCIQEAQRLFHGRLQSLGYPAAFRDLPGSSHQHLSEAGLQILADAILERT
jgi:hypothetical protein